MLNDCEMFKTKTTPRKVDLSLNDGDDDGK